jgi:hypothetical protein
MQEDQLNCRIRHKSGENAADRRAWTITRPRNPGHGSRHHPEIDEAILGNKMKSQITDNILYRKDAFE